MKAAAHAAKFPSQPSQKSHSVNQMSGGALINLCRQPGGHAAGSGQGWVQGTCRCQSVNAQCMRPSVCQSVSQLVESVNGQQWSYRVGQTGSGIALAPPTQPHCELKPPTVNRTSSRQLNPLFQHSIKVHGMRGPRRPPYSPRILLSLRSRPPQAFTLIPNHPIPTHVGTEACTEHSPRCPCAAGPCVSPAAHCPLPSADPPMCTPACCCRPCIVIGVFG